MYLNFWGNRLPTGALEEQKQKAGGIVYAIWWNKVPSITCSYGEINKILDTLEGKDIPRQEVAKGCKTISRTWKLGEGYFIRKAGNNIIEVCGAYRKDGRNSHLFRFVITQNKDEDAGRAYNEFRAKVKEKCGVSLSVIFGGLPEEYHQYRGCVPSPINWASSAYTMARNCVAEGCVKADICSAYGTEGSKTLPDCHISRCRIVDGKVAPSEDFPFAFYLNSGHMAIWGEGTTEQLNKSRYITIDHTKFVSEEKTLLCPAAKYSLRAVFEDLYEGRKDNPGNKFVMNATIGMFHRKVFTEQQDNLWPIAAVIKFRCNKRIVDECERLAANGCKPLLINTDSILWRGPLIDGFAREKALGNFTIEYEKCRAVMRSPKIYQVQDVESGETITRWSGAHSKKYTSELAFGRIWEEKIYQFLQEEEMKNTVRWDDKTCRYVNKLYEIYTEEECVIWQEI